MHEGRVAANMRALTADSPLLQGERGRVHDPYCLRCVPQVHGASRDAFRYVAAATLLELNAFTDNPLVFPEEDEVVSGGNFHAQPVGLPMDLLAILVAELGSISQRRTQQIIRVIPVAEVASKEHREDRLHIVGCKVAGCHDAGC